MEGCDLLKSKVTWRSDLPSFKNQAKQRVLNKFYLLLPLLIYKIVSKAWSNPDS